MSILRFTLFVMCGRERAAKERPGTGIPSYTSRNKIDCLLQVQNKVYYCYNNYYYYYVYYH